MRRFGRRRRGNSSSDVSIDAARWLGRILEEKIVPLRSLEPLGSPATDEVPPSLAAVGVGEDESGAKTLVSFAPRFAGDALFGGLVAALRMAEEEQFSGELVVVAPQWSAAARRRLGLVSPSGFRVRGLAAPSLAEAPTGVEAELMAEPGIVPIESVIGALARPADRELFERASTALAGLAAKHGGAMRGFGRSLELVIMARRVAELRADESGVVLNTVLPTKSTLRLSAEGLSGALDGLEGNLRKRLNDRRTREGDEGMRTRLIPLVATALGLRSATPWPLGGNDLDLIDVVGVNAEGSPVAVASRGTLTLQGLGLVVDAALELRAAFPNLLANAQPPVRFEQLRLALTAKEFAPGVTRVLAVLSLAHDLLEIRGGGRDRGVEVSLLGSGEAAPIASAPRKRPSRRGERGRETRSDEPEERESATPDEASEGVSADSSEAPRGRSRRRGRRSRGGRDGAAPDAEASADGSEAGEDEGDRSEKEGKRKGPRFEELSAFDLLEDESRSEGEEGAGRSRRRGGRSRRRGRRSGGEGATGDGGGEGDAPNSDDADAGPPAAEPDDDAIDIDDSDLLEGQLAALPDSDDDDDAPVKIAYDPDEEDDEDTDPEAVERVIEREKRRRRRKAAKEEPVVVEPPKPVRRRVAIVAHADRDSILGAVLLARDLRLLEGIWVYTQDELMTFFRSVATDLREETPIHLIGFTPKPARDIIQAAAIYSGRLTWYDHSVWPPEDTEALSQAIGSDFVLTAPGAESSLPLILQSLTRRSRFSDKLVDLAAGRFTEHDYERWGRLWWVRLAEFAARSGQRRPDLEPLLNGRPSDLAKEASKIDRPPIPKEVVFVSERDFRLIHFAGHSLVVVEVPPEYDLHLSARIARERYCASLSLAMTEGDDLAVLAGDEVSGRNSQDCGSVVQHLADKFSWVESLADDDHVARFLLRDRAQSPGRLDDVIGAIAMARSLFDR